MSQHGSSAIGRAVVGICLCAYGHIAIAQETLYHVTTIGFLPGDWASRGYGINELGQVAASSLDVIGGVSEAALWDPQTGMLGLGDLLGQVTPFSVAVGLNELGHVVGTAVVLEPGRGGSTNVGTFWSPESGMLSVGALPASNLWSLARDINNRDQIVGVSAAGYQPALRQEAFLWDWHNDSMLGLGDLPGGNTVSVAWGVNDDEQVVGWSCSFRGCEPFLWDRTNGMIGLGDLWNLPNFADGTAYAINNAGQVVGIAASPQGGQAFLWEAGRGMIGLGTLPGFESFTSARHINERGEVVGLWYHGGIPNIFIWDEANGMRIVNDMLDVSGRPFIGVDGSRGINNRGEIVCTATTMVRPEAAILTPFVLADMNCDGRVDGGDIEPFFLALGDLPAHAARYPDCHGDWAGDLNQDGAFNGGDIDPFFTCLAGGICR